MTSSLAPKRWRRCSKACVPRTKRRRPSTRRFKRACRKPLTSWKRPSWTRLRPAKKRIAAETVTVTTSEAAAAPVPEEDRVSPRPSTRRWPRAGGAKRAWRPLSTRRTTTRWSRSSLEMGALRERLAETELHYETERHRNVEADVLIKSLDLKIATLEEAPSAPKRRRRQPPRRRRTARRSRGRGRALRRGQRPGV